MSVASGINAIGGLSLVLAIIFVSGRLVSNALLFRRLYRDDLASIVGALLFIAFTGVCIGIEYFASHDSTSSTDVTGAAYSKLVYNAELLYALTSVAAKLSVLLLYLRIFSPSNHLRQAIYAVSTAVALLSISSVSVFSFYCAPNAETTGWSPNMATVCSSANSFALTQSVLDSALNLTVLLLPVPSIMRLHLSLKRRLGIVFILMHGVFALVACSVAVFYRVGLWRAGAGPSALWWRTAALECGVVELSMTLVSGSLHACWGYIRSFKARQEAKSNASGSTLSYSREKSDPGDRRSRTRGTGGSSRTLRVEEIYKLSTVAEPKAAHTSISEATMAATELGEPRVSLERNRDTGISVQTEMTMWVELARAEQGARDSIVI